MKHLVLLCLVLSLVFGCNESPDSRQESLPEASGALGKVLVVVDSLTWQGETGLSLKKMLQEAHPGVIQPEPYFDISYLPEEHFGGFLTQHKFIFLPLTLERMQRNPLFRSLIPVSVVEQVKADTSFTLFRKRDVFSSGQTLFFLLVKDKNKLVEVAQNQKRNLQQLLLEELLDGYDVKLRSKKINETLEKRIQDEYNLFSHIPYNFELVTQEDDFLWFRNFTSGADLNILINKSKYIDVQQFSDTSMVSWRDRIGEKFLQYDQSEQMYMETEKLTFPFIVEMSNKSIYRKKMWGLWKMKNQAMGGSFVSEIFHDHQKEEIYYVEGFVYAPGQEKLPYIHRLESILRTIKPFKE